MSSLSLRILLWLSVLLTAACVTHLDKPRPKIDKAKVSEANIKLGMAYLQQKQRDSALSAFSKALEADKRAGEAHLGMAMIHQLNGEADDAEAAFKRAYRYRSEQTQANISYTYAMFLKEHERCKEAFPLFEQASKDLTFPSRAEVIYNLGLCADKLGDSERAMAAYKHALNLNRRHSAAALELAYKQFALGDYAQAKKNLDRHSDNTRQSARSLWLGIQIERVFGNKDKEASYVLALKNLYPYSREYLMYKELLLKDAAGKRQP